MKSLNPFLLVLITCPLFSQQSPTKITYQAWDPDRSKWETTFSTHNEYNSDGNLTLQIRRIFDSEQFIGNSIITHTFEYGNSGMLVKETEDHENFESGDREIETKTYNEHGDLILLELEKWNTEIGEMRPVIKTEYERIYEPTKNTIINGFTWLETNQAYWKSTERIFQYDENDCLEEYIFRRYTISEVLEKERIETYLHDEECRQLFYTHTFEDFFEGIYHQSKDSTVYLPDLMQQHNYSYSYQDTSNTFELSAFTVSDLDEQGRVIKAHTEFGVGGHATFYYSYDEHGNQTGFREYFQQFNWPEEVLLSWDSAAYHDNEEDRLLLEEHWIGTVATSFGKYAYIYDYYCDGSLKKVTSEFLPAIYRRLYEYASFPDCENSEKKLDLKLYPNPVSTFLFLESPHFIHNPSILSIYSIDGRLQQRTELNSRSILVNLKINHLEEGFYFLSVESRGEIQSRGFFVEK